MLDHCASVMPAAALELWRFAATASARVDIFPDGCRDLIVRVAPDGSACCLVSAITDGVTSADLVAGQRVVGVRLRPGAVFDELALVSHLRPQQRYDESDLLAAIAEFAKVDVRVEECLCALAACARLGSAQTSLGVSERTLERFLRASTGRGPLFWKNLARARRAARALAGKTPLSDIAADQGYADQAHMTRDLRRWFGATPSQIRTDPEGFAALAATGHG